MSELILQQAIQAKIQAMSEFADADVRINDWSALGESNENAPYVIIETADSFSSRQDSLTPNNKWDEKVTLVEKFVDWPTTLNNLQTRRQALIDQFNTVGSARSANGQPGVTADEIRSDGPITPVYPAYLTDEQIAEALPIFLEQRMIFAFEEF